MLLGSIYALLNPSFPDKVKLGRTIRPASARALELSRHTGVPDAFVVLYDELVIDSERAERDLHARFARQRSRQSREFFRVSPKEAILAIQEIARHYPVPSDTECIRVPLLGRIEERFPGGLRPDLVSVTLLQFEYLCALEFVLQTSPTHTPQRRIEELLLGGLSESKYLLSSLAHENADRLLAVDDYSFIQVTDLLTAEATQEILERERLHEHGA